MSKNRFRAFLAVSMASILIVSCSTTRLLEDGQYRLAKNTVTVTNSEKFNTSEITPYLKHKPGNSMIFGWNPFTSVYNWSGRDTSRIFNKLFRKIGVAPTVYDSSLVVESATNIEKHLEYLGYYNSSVATWTEINRRKIKVNYDVTLGKRYLIDNIEYVVPQNGTFAKDFLADETNVSIKKGDWLSEAALEAESARSAAHMNNIGYFGFSKNYYIFEADTLAKPGAASLKMIVREYTRNEPPSNARILSKYDIGEVSISYPKSLKFNQKVLTDMNTLMPGESYSGDKIQKVYDRFSSLKTFSGVNVEMTRRDSNLVDCAINLSQASLMGFKTGIEASSNSSGLIGISPQLSFYNRNFFHGGEWLTVNFMGNFQFRSSDHVRSNEFGFSTGLSLPRLLFLPSKWFSQSNTIPRTEIKISYNFQDRPEYLRNIISTSFGYSGIFRPRMSYQIYPVQASVVRLYNLDQEFFKTLESNPFLKYAYQNHVDIGTGATFYYSTNSDLTPKSSYYFARLQTDFAGNTLGFFHKLMKENADGSHSIWGTPYSQYVRAELQIGKAWAFGRDENLSFATRLLGGIGHAYGNSSAMPFEKQFYSGGANSLRGWQARAVGPGSSPINETFVIPSQTGNMKLEANAEFRFPVFWKFAGAVFVDAGNVWTVTHIDKSDEKSNEEFNIKNFPESIAADWGLGIRFNLGFILLRVDYGMQLRNPSLEGNKWVGANKWFKSGFSALHFGVGYPF